MAGEFTAGLSGGQRKLLLFELIYQRTKSQSDLLIVLDEPFAGVTDDFVPHIVSRLNEMRMKHNILLVTNDHVQTLTSMSDNTVTVSAIDRKKVKVNGSEADRDIALLAMSIGNDYVHSASNDDLKFFFDVEVLSNGALGGVAAFTTFSMLLFIASFWDSQDGSEALVLVAIQIIAFFCINPYLIALADWRNYMTEEAEALMHSSISTNKALKSVLTLVVLLVISAISFGVLNLVIHTMGSFDFFISMLFDSASLTLPFICFGLYSTLPLQVVQILASFPFLFMIFFSTTFSPGAGIDGTKWIRFLFARFYFWCMVPGVKDLMEDCPADDVLPLYTVLSGCLGLFLFLALMGILTIKASYAAKAADSNRKSISESAEFKKLQVEMFGEDKIASFSLKKAGGATAAGFSAIPTGDDAL